MRKFLKLIAFFLSLKFLIVLTFLFLSSLYASKKIALDLDVDDKYLIVGHSRPECAYDDIYIDSTANISHSRESYFYSYLKLKAVLSKNSGVEKVFIEFTDNNVSGSMDQWIFSDLEMRSNFVRYACFMTKSEVIDLVKNNPKGVARAIPLVLKRNLGYINSKDNLIDDFGGFNSLSHELDISEYDFKRNTVNENISDLNLIYLDKIIDMCDKYAIDIYLIRTPVNEHSLAHPQFEQILDQGYSDLEFLDFSEFRLRDSELADLEHLNHSGAERYSKWFNKFLKLGNFDQTTIDSLISIENSGFQELSSIIN